jgi:hypothetical protein
MPNNDQLTVFDIRGPYAQLLVNFQGENGRGWLDAFKLFLSKKNPWNNISSAADFREELSTRLDRIEGTELMHDVLYSLASVLQSRLANGEARSRVQNAGSLEVAMRSIMVAIEDSEKSQGRESYILHNLEQSKAGLARAFERASTR